MPIQTINDEEILRISSVQDNKEVLLLDEIEELLNDFSTGQTLLSNEDRLKGFGSLESFGEKAGRLVISPFLLSPGELGEAVEEVFDIAARPGKAVWGAIDEFTEFRFKEKDSVAMTMAKALGITNLPRASRGFMEGLKGERGAKEFLNRLGISDKTADQVEKERAKRGVLGNLLHNPLIVNPIISAIGDEAFNNPATFFGDMLDLEVIPSGLAAVSGGIKAVRASTHLGIAASKKLRKELGEKGFAAISEAAQRAAKKGGGGAKQFLKDINGMPDDIRESFRNMLKAKAPVDQARAQAGVPLAETEGIKLARDLRDLRGFVARTLPNKFRPELQEKSLSEFIANRRSEFVRQITQDPTERALANYVVQQAPEARLLDSGTQEILFRSINQHRKANGLPNLDHATFGDLDLSGILRNLPESKGKLVKSDMKLRATTTHPDVMRILGKHIDDITEDEFQILMSESGVLTPDTDDLVKIYKDLGRTPYEKTGNKFLNPAGWARINFMKPTFDEMGLTDDFFYPVLTRWEQEQRALTNMMGKFNEALKPIGINRVLDFGAKKKFERIGKFLDGQGDIVLSPQEFEAAQNVKKLFKELADVFEIKESKRITEYLPRIIERNFDESLSSSFDVNPIIGQEFFKKLRTGAASVYPTDIVKVAETYMKVGYRGLYRRELHEGLMKKLDDLKLPSADDAFIREFLESYKGNKVNSKLIEPMAENILNSPLFTHFGLDAASSKEIAQQTAYNLLQFGYLTGMGLNFRLGIRNYFQRFLAVPRTSLKSYINGERMRKLFKGVKKGRIVDSDTIAEVQAYESIMNDIPIVKQRVGVEAARPDINFRNQIRRGNLERLTTKLTEATGFGAADAGNVQQTVTTGLIHSMERRGIKNFRALANHPKKGLVMREAEKLAADAQLIYSRINRPLALRNPEGGFLLQYNTFGPHMANLAMRDFFRPSQRSLGVKTMLWQGLLSGTLTAGGLSGLGYGAYFALHDPFKRVGALVNGEADRAFKSPAIKAGVGLTKFATGSVTQLFGGGGGKKLMKKGQRELKKSFQLASVSNLQQALDFNDVSRIFLIKPFSRKKSFIKKDLSKIPFTTLGIRHELRNSLRDKLRKNRIL